MFRHLLGWLRPVFHRAAAESAGYALAALGIWMLGAPALRLPLTEAAAQAVEDLHYRGAYALLIVLVVRTMYQATRAFMGAGR